MQTQIDKFAASGDFFTETLDLGTAEVKFSALQGSTGTVIGFRVGEPGSTPAPTAAPTPEPTPEPTPVPKVPLAITGVVRTDDGSLRITGTAPIGAAVTCYNADLDLDEAATRSGPSFTAIIEVGDVDDGECSDGTSTASREPPKQKTFTVSGGRVDGVKGPFTLKVGDYTLKWTARGGDTGSCFGKAWLNTPHGSDTDPYATIFDLYANTTRTRTGSTEVFIYDPGKYVIGTITTCRWTVTFVNTSGVY